MIIDGVLLSVAGTAALIGKRELTQATPPVPAEAVAGLKEDARTLKSGNHS